MAGRITHKRIYLPCSLSYRKLQQHSTTPPHNPTVDALHTDTDSHRSNLAEVEPAPKDSRAHIAEQPEISPEIPQTPITAVENIQHGEDNNSDDGNTPLRSHASTDTAGDDSAVTGDGDLEAEEGRSFVRHRLQKDDRTSVQTNHLQRASQIELIVNICDSYGASIPITKSSEHSRLSDRFGLEFYLTRARTA